MTTCTSERLELRPVPWDAVEAVVKGERLPGWAEDFPDEGDVVIARMLHRAGSPAPDVVDGLWGHHQVIERSSGAVAGGVGFFGPPDDGVTEIGYGVVPSRQDSGYATEAVIALLSAGWDHHELQAVVATTDTENVASQRVLEKAGFALAADGEAKGYRIPRPPLVR